jgi:predicted Zn-dependent peptidase
MAFPPEHPYHHSVIGSMRDLSAASVEDVSHFFRTYYAPNNAVLVLAGDIDLQQARALVRKHFDDIPRGPAPAPLADMDLPPLIGAERRTVLEEKHAPAPGVFFMYRVPAGRDARPVVELLAGILGQGNSSRLYKSLVREKQLATEVAAMSLGLAEGADVLAVYALGKPGSSPDSLERALKQEIDGLRQGIRQDELDRVRAGARHAFVDGLQVLGGFGGRADRLAEGWTFYRDPNYVNTVLPRYDAVTVAELQRLAVERIVPMNRVTVVAIPTRQLPGVIVP